MTTKNNATILIGWGGADITPDQPVNLAGQFHSRVSEGVLDPVTATALAFEAPEAGTAAVLVSCDLVSISDGLRDAVRARLPELAPGLDPLLVFLNATHTHTAPESRSTADAAKAGTLTSQVGVELPVMSTDDFVAFAAGRIAAAVGAAWKSRAPGGIGFGLGFAVIGRNRRISYYDGRTEMYGSMNTPDFSHIEGYEDHALNLLCTYDMQGKLTGLVVNLACPSQVREQGYQISADFWHETRQELRNRLGRDLFVLAQNSAAGDQSPHLPGRPEDGRGRVPGKENAEVRMWRLAGRNQCQDIAVRIADAVETILPLATREIDWSPRLQHLVQTVELTRRPLEQKDVDEAMEEAVKWRAKFEELRAGLEANPEKRLEPRWYVPITQAFRRLNWFEGVRRRFEEQQEKSKLPFEIHVLRLGDVAFATNPFEYYVDFGMQIKARSKAVQTFLVQHVGTGTYVPSPRAVAGKSYGAVPASTPVGAEGGRELSLRTVELINSLWEGQGGQ